MTAAGIARLDQLAAGQEAPGAVSDRMHPGPGTRQAQQRHRL